MTALTAIVWLLATFNLATLALRSILFFGLSLPQSHITDAVYPTREGREKAKKIPGEMLSQRSYDAEEGDDGPLFGIEEVQAEVDMRVRCERPPFESWEWVWWAWWAHKRGPVGHVFASFAGLMSLVTVREKCGPWLFSADDFSSDSLSDSRCRYLMLQRRTVCPLGEWRTSQSPRAELTEAALAFSCPSWR